MDRQGFLMRGLGSHARLQGVVGARWGAAIELERRGSRGRINCMEEKWESGGFLQKQNKYRGEGTQ